MKIVFLDAATMGEVSFAAIEKFGELVLYRTSSPEEALKRVGDCDVLIINKVRVTPKLIDAAPRLRLICEAATGVNNIDLAYAEKILRRIGAGMRRERHVAAAENRIAAVRRL